MDFVDWCSMVLRKLIEATDLSPENRSIGVDEFQLAQTIFGNEFANQSEYYSSKQREGMFDALRELEQVHLVESSSLLSKVTRFGRELIQDNDMTPLWQSICQNRLGPEEKQLLMVVNRLSAQEAEDHAWITEVNHNAILSELEGPYDVNSLWPLSLEMEQLGLIACDKFLGSRIEFQATYRGLVWETRRGFTLTSKFIDELRVEWETTSVDFKRELHLNTADEKAEFIKDVLSLANTKASGRRWLISSFDNRSHRYYGPPDRSITQDRIEQLVSAYTTPFVDVRYEVVEYRDGPVGMLEVLRDPKKLTYSVARSIGDRKRIEQGDIFVRHGSHVEKPTMLEKQALQDEGDQARANS